MSLTRSLRRLRARFMRTLTYRGLVVPIHGAHVIRPIKDELMEGRYEVPEIEALLQLLRPGDSVVEVGVGLGVVSGIAAMAVPDARIACFEANPELIDPIRELHALNGITSIALHNAILVRGEGGETRDFHIHWSFAEGSLIESADTSRTVQVPTVSLEDTLADMKPDVLVIDIEGGEDELLSGLDLCGLRALVLELHPKVISRQAEVRIYQACAQAGLYPRVELSKATVVAFERLV